MQRPVTFGIDVGGTKVLGLAVDASGAVLAELQLPTPDFLGTERPKHQAGEELVWHLAALVTELQAGAGSSSDTHSPPLRVGVGVPGLVDNAGVLRFAPNLSVGAGLEVGRLLSERLGGAQVVVENDATCATVGEWTHGAAVGVSDAVIVTLGTGIGGGIVVDGRVVRGANGFAGEIGHMVVNPAGPECPCGRRGCWERYASGGGLGRLTREAARAGRLAAAVERAGGDPEAVRGEDVTRAAQAGDSEARAILTEHGWWLALGLANLANIFDTAVIVLGGGLISALGPVLGPVRRTFEEMTEGRQMRPPVKIVLAELGDRAGAIGAALIAREQDDRHASTT